MTDLLPDLGLLLAESLDDLLFVFFGAAAEVVSVIGGEVLVVVGVIDFVNLGLDAIVFIEQRLGFGGDFVMFVEVMNVHEVK